MEDTLRVMAITFSYLEGAESLDAFLNKRGNTPYSYLLYSSLGDLYVEKQRYQDAATTYRAYVARDPNSDHAPNLAMQGIEAYRKGGFTQLVLDGKHEYVERYNFGTPFWQGRDRAQVSAGGAGAEDQPEGRRHVLPRHGAEVEEDGGFPGSRASGIAIT